MPRVNIFIRKENEHIWGVIKDKSAWVNDMLQLYDKQVLQVNKKAKKTSYTGPVEAA